MLSLLTRTIPVVLIIGILCSFAWLTAASGQPPSSIEDETTQQAIRDALKGKPSSAGENDPLLQDVLDLIKGRGSLLSGSSLELTADDTGAAEQPEPGKTTNTHATRTAEALLKACRLLGKMPNNPKRLALIDQMRLEASNCLEKFRSEPQLDQGKL